MAKAKPKSTYDKHREGMAAVSRERSESGRDIGPPPAVADPARRGECRESLRLFCETYLADRFRLSWSPDHLKVIERIEASILTGGLFALAMPRGSGKTSLAEAGALWAILYGHRRFVVLIGATDEAATEMMDSIKMAVETGEELGEDFPEVCYPVRELEGINNRASGQTVGGVRTRITWTNKEVVFPTVAGSAASGAVIHVTGITGRIRGMKAATADGETIRPDFAIADDPQTDQSAVSLPDIDKRERRLRGAVKGLAGPGKTISMVVPCTVIAPRDLSDRILDRDRNPQFQGERMKMLYAWPKRMDLWEEYGELRRTSLRDGRKGEEATEFYLDRCQEMDDGAAVAWADRYDRGLELSAVQAAMNLYYDNRAEFLAEYQNEPEDEARAAGSKELDAGSISARVSGVERLMVPGESTRLVAFIDCGLFLHWYAVVAFNEAFGGSVIDYGCWPFQARSFFAADDAQTKLADQYPGMSPAQLVFRGLEDLSRHVLGRVYYRQGGGEATVERCLVDSGFETKAVYQWVRQSPYVGIVYPSKGIGRTISSRGVSEWKPRPGERSGYHWRLTAGEESRVKAVQYDPDAWKSFLYGALTTPPGGATGVSLFGRESAKHEMIGHHLAAEYASPVTLRGTTFDKWQVKPDRPDNHLLDCVVGACVAASVTGLAWSATGQPEKAKPAAPAKSLKDQQAEALARFRAKQKAGAR